MAATDGPSRRPDGAKRRRRGSGWLSTGIRLVLAVAFPVYGAVLIGLGISGQHNQHVLATAGGADAITTGRRSNRRGPGRQSRFPPRGAWAVAAIPPTVVVVRGVPWWGVVSSAAAPVLLVGGWRLAAALQPGGYNEVTRTVSALASEGATDRWVMTLAFVIVGACDVLTALALRPAAPPGRLILIVGGVAGMLVAASPDHGGGGSLAHALWAVVGFAALTAWPLGSYRRGRSVPWSLRPGVSVGVTCLLLGLLGWFLVELIDEGGLVGLAERVLGTAQALWPLVVVLSCRRARPGPWRWRPRPALTFRAERPR